MRMKSMAAAFVAAGFGAALAAPSAHAADAALIAAAKKEGRVTWYTTAIVNQLVRPVAQAFEAKYGIHVDYVRANTAGIELRIVNEKKAGHVLDDVFDGTTTVAGLEQVGLAEKWTPDAAKALPKQFVDPHGYWVATNQYVLTPAYNTNLLKKADAPKTYDDLLNPKYKGRIIWAFTESASAGPGFIGLTLAARGERKGMEFLKKFAAQKVASVNASARQVLDQVIAGEFAIGLQMFNDQASLSASQGAPVAWIPMNPAMSVLSVAGLNKGAPHPNAGKLLIDFLISPEGQKLFQKADYVTVDPKFPPRDPAQVPDGKKFKAIYFTPEQIQSAMPKWVSIYNQLFR